MNLRLNLFKTKNGKALAYGSITIEEQICISNVSLYPYENKKTKKKDAFLSFPSYQTNDGDYKNYVFPVTAELRTALNEGAKRLYKEMVKNKESKGVIEFFQDDIDQFTEEAPKKKSTKKKTKKKSLDEEIFEDLEDEDILEPVDEEEVPF